MAIKEQVISRNKRRRWRRKKSIREKLSTTTEGTTSTTEGTSLFDYNPESLIVTVFDGSRGPNPTTKRHPSIATRNWRSISIRSGGLAIVKPSSSLMGIKSPEIGGQSVFTMPPRSKVLSTLRLYDESHAIRLYDSLRVVEKIQKVSTKRHVPILNDGYPTHKYVGGYGVTVNRCSTGISKSAVYKRTPPEHTTIINQHAGGMEYIFRSFGNIESVSVAEAGSRLINHPTIDGCRIYSGLAFGTNTYLPVHTDKDFTSSIVMVINRNKCVDNEEESAYFCFPRMAVAVPLRPGDVLIFDPREPHCLSSRCRSEDELVCLSLYLKSAVVGLNNNSRVLTKKEQRLADLYDT